MKLRDFKDKHLGEDVVIMGSGPSLNTADMSVLPYCNTIAYNAGFLKTTPTYYTTADPNFPTFIAARDDATFVNRPFFICQQWKNVLPPRSNELVFQKFPYPPGRFTELIKPEGPLAPRLKNIFDDCTLIEKGVSAIGSGLIEMALPLAFYMGFERVFLIGVDFTPSNELSKDSHHFYDDPGQFDRFDWKLWNSLGGLWESKRWIADLWLESNKAHRIFHLDPDTKLGFQKASWDEIKKPTVLR